MTRIFILPLLVLSLLVPLAYAHHDGSSFGNFQPDSFTNFFDNIMTGKFITGFEVVDTTLDIPDPQLNEVCNNYLDDDADGLIDCQDDDCVGFGGYCEYPDEVTCDDLIDNDNDNMRDCRDPNCAQAPSCQPTSTETVCDNLIDDDNDGDVDCQDNDCAQDPNCALIGTTENNCRDNIDNDGDGDTDCADTDCRDRPVCQQNPGGIEQCEDGIDNDNDGFIDCQDQDCLFHTSCDEGDEEYYRGDQDIRDIFGYDSYGSGYEICNDFYDNDGDAYIDCDDSDCYADPSCTQVVAAIPLPTSRPLNTQEITEIQNKFGEINKELLDLIKTLRAYEETLARKPTGPLEVQNFRKDVMDRISRMAGQLNTAEVEFQTREKIDSDIVKKVTQRVKETLQTTRVRVVELNTEEVIEETKKAFEDEVIPA